MKLYDDPEIDAMASVWTVLKALDDEAAQRILSWVDAKLRYRRMVATGLIRQDGSLGEKFDGSQVVPLAEPTDGPTKPETGGAR